MFEGRSTSMTCIEAPNSIASTCAEFLHLYSRYYKPHAGYRDEILACMANRNYETMGEYDQIVWLNVLTYWIKKPLYLGIFY